MLSFELFRYDPSKCKCLEHAGIIQHHMHRHVPEPACRRGRNDWRRAAGQILPCSPARRARLLFPYSGAQGGGGFKRLIRQVLTTL
jgi:hypothetical protein